MLKSNSVVKTFSWLLTALSLTLIFLFLITRIAAAESNLQTDGNIFLEKNEVVNKDYFATGDSVTISGTVNGDAYIGAGKITVDGTVNGDLIAGGGEIIINGTVAQNIRVAGGNITISGSIGRNATVLGGNINFTNDSKLAGSLVSAGGNLNLYSPIGKDVYLGAGDVTIGNKVGGDINAGIGNLTLTPNSSVSGNLNYLSEQTARIMNGASISGQIKHTLPPREKKQAEKTGQYVAGGFIAFYKSMAFTSLLVFGFILIKLLPNFSLGTAKTLSSDFWSSLVTGILTLVLVPIAFLILLITILGIPLAFILLFGFMLAVFVSKVFVSIWLGNFIAAKLNQKWNLYISLLTGLITLTLLSFIPVLGFLISVIVYTAGMGALLLSKRNLYLKLKKEL